MSRPGAAHADGAEPAPGRIVYVGHATVLVELDGTRVLTDPVLRSRLLLLRSRHGGVDVAPLRDLDAVLVSHAHRDHLDLASLRLLAPDVRVIAARAAAAAARRRGFRGPIEPVEPGDRLRVGGVSVRATPAVHGRPGSAVGFVVEGSATVYFAGDTDLFAGMRGLADPLDVALLPVWGWGPRLGSGHLDPERAVEAVRRLRPRAAVPIHWGTLHPLGLSRAAFLEEPPRTFARLAAERAPEVAVHTLGPGGELPLPVVATAPG